MASRAAMSRLSTFASAERSKAMARAASSDPMNTVVSQLLRGRVTTFASVRASTPVLEAVRIMSEKNTGSLIVLGEPASQPAATADSKSTAKVSPSPSLCGIVTERDVLLACPRLVKQPSDSPLLVADIMSDNPTTVSSDATVGECMSMMVDRGFRHLPVVEKGELVGLLGIRDLVKRVTEENRSHVADLNVQLGRLANILGEELTDSAKAHTTAPEAKQRRKSWWQI